MIVYLSGPITNEPNYMKNFDAAETELSKMVTVINPAKIGEQIKSLPYEDILDIDLKILTHCDAIYLLRGWENSNGAVTELSYAKAAGLKIIYQV